MAQTVSAIYLHLIFATRNREPSIVPELKRELHAYIGGVARNLGAVALEVGGVVDHVHALVSVPPVISAAEIVGKLKSNSSRWIHQRVDASFAWQTGYGAFSVSKSNIDDVRTYIREQEQHHRTVSFKEEFLLFLKRHEVEYDPQYVFD